MFIGRCLMFRGAAPPADGVVPPALGAVPSRGGLPLLLYREGGGEEIRIHRHSQLSHGPHSEETEATSCYGCPAVGLETDLEHGKLGPVIGRRRGPTVTASYGAEVHLAPRPYRRNSRREAPPFTTAASGEITCAGRLPRGPGRATWVNLSSIRWTR
jgi:hypothetical protein